MRVNILVYDRHGVPLGEIEKASNISRSFALNRSTQMTFDLAPTHPKATRTLLDYGNVIVCYSDKVPAWSGYIVKPDWGEDNITITRYSIEQRLSLRRIEPLKFKSSPYGDIFRHLITYANAIEPTGINVGDVFMGGPRVSMDLGVEDPYQKLTDLCDTAQYDYQVLMLEPGLWEIDFYEQIGSDLTDRVFLQMGHDTDGPPTYSEDWSTYCNYVLAVGSYPSDYNQSNDDGWTHRPKAVYMDSAQIAARGLAQDVLDISDVSDVPTLYLRRQKEAKSRMFPKKTLGFTLSERRDLWGQFEVGDIVAVQNPYQGFGGIVVPFRITGYEVKEDTDQMAVVGDVVQGEKALTLKMYLGAHYG